MMMTPMKWQELLNAVAAADSLKESMDNVVVKQTLEQTLNSVIHDRNICLHVFGSRILGTAQLGSDLDIFVEIDHSFGEYSFWPESKVYERQRLIADVIRKSSEWLILEVVNARCPIVIAKHKATGIPCDLSFSSGLITDQNILVNYIFKLQPMARYMTIYLRDVVAEYGLKSKFRTHILILMVILFFQVEKLLPGIDKLQTNLSPSVGPWITKFNKFSLAKFGMQQVDLNQEKMNELLKKFYGFYGSFDFETLVVCPYLGKPVHKLQLADQMPQRYKTTSMSMSSPVIQDIVELNNNKGYPVNLISLASFKRLCRKES